MCSSDLPGILPSIDQRVGARGNAAASRSGVVGDGIVLQGAGDGGNTVGSIHPDAAAAAIARSNGVAGDGIGIQHRVDTKQTDASTGAFAAVVLDGVVGDFNGGFEKLVLAIDVIVDVKATAVSHGLVALDGVVVDGDLGAADGSDTDTAALCILGRGLIAVDGAALDGNRAVLEVSVDAAAPAAVGGGVAGNGGILDVQLGIVFGVDAAAGTAGVAVHLGLQQIKGGTGGQMNAAALAGG